MTTTFGDETPLKRPLSGIATRSEMIDHDDRFAFARIGWDKFEFKMLYGIRRDLRLLA